MSMTEYPKTRENDRILLGLEISRLHLKEGETRTCEELAAFCGCSRRNIEKIEERAMAKMRTRLGSFENNL